MIVTVLIGGFIVSFRKWGIGDVVDVKFGIYNLFLAVFIVALNLFVSMSVMKLYGLKIGHSLKFSFGKFSALISLFVVFLSDGWLPFFATGTFKSTIMPHIRHGRIRPGLQLIDLAKISLIGTISSILIALICKILMLSTIFSTNYVVNRIMVISVIFAIITMLPFPEFNGFHVFFCSRLMYIFTYVVIIAIGLFFLVLGIGLSIILALLIGGAAWILYYLLVERNL